MINSNLDLTEFEKFEKLYEELKLLENRQENQNDTKKYLNFFSSIIILKIFILNKIKYLICFSFSKFLNKRTIYKNK